MITTNDLLIFTFAGLVGEGLAIYKEKPLIRTGAQILHHAASILPIVVMVSKKILTNNRSCLGVCLKNASVGLTVGIAGVAILSPLAPFFRKKGYLGSYDETEDKIKSHNFITDKDYHDYLVTHYTKRTHQLMIIISIAEVAFAMAMQTRSNNMMKSLY